MKPGPDQPNRPNISRRSFMIGALGALAALILGRKRARSYLAVDRPVGGSFRGQPIVPAGAGSLASFRARCTGCQLCVAACPEGVLKTTDGGLNFLQPTLNYGQGYCRENCVVCSQVCPTGAIRPIRPTVKNSTQIGQAQVVSRLCLVQSEGRACTECARVCPQGAVRLVVQDGLRRPLVDPERCTGCGACEYHCPVRPGAAIRVEGNSWHQRV